MKRLLCLAVLGCSIASAQVKISQLPTGSTITGSELVPMVQSGTTVTETMNAIAAFGSRSSAAPTALVGLTAITGSTGNYMDAGSAPALNQTITPTMTGAWIFTSGVQFGTPSGGNKGAGTINAAAGIYSNGTLLANCVFASPTATIGLTSATGTTGNCMDAGSAPALNQGISPTWTGTHIFTQGVQLGSPSGGNEGAGTLNSSGGIYVNGIPVVTSTTGCTTGNFTATLTGMSSTTTGTASYTLCGYHVYLVFPSSVSGTSNSTAMQISGLPTALQPLNVDDYIGECEGVENSGTGGISGAVESTETASTLQIVIKSVSSSLVVTGNYFTASGTKGFPAGAACFYDM